MANPAFDVSTALPVGHDLAKYRRRLFGVVAHAVGSPDLAEDIVQETFARGLDKIRSLREADKLYPWLRTIALRLASDHFRKAMNHHEVNVDDINGLQDSHAFDEENGLEVMIKVETEGQLRAVLQALSDDERVALSFELDDMAISDIAAALDRTVKAVHMLRHRAKCKLRERLGELS